MADMRAYDEDAGSWDSVKQINKAVRTYGLARNAQAVTAGATNTTIYGFRVSVVGGSGWTYTPVDGGSPVSFTPLAGETFPVQATQLVVPTGGAAEVYTG